MIIGIRNACVALTAIASATLSASAFAQAPTVQKVFTIGCESYGGSLEFSSISDIATDSRGELLVADRSAPLLREFNGAGTPGWSGGAKGKGPGEYTGITRLAWLTSGAYNIVDGGGNRITTLTCEHKVATTTPLTAYPTTAAVNDAGAVVLGLERPTGRGFSLLKWKDGVLEKVELAVPPGKPALAFDGASIAVSPDGSIALWPDANRYEIVRLNASGVPLPGISRTIERARYTAVEDSMRLERADKELTQMRSMGGITSIPPKPKPGPPPLKPYMYGDGLRYDSKGRLWVHTMYGNETHTIFDVFSPTGAFLGSVNIPGIVRQFALGGTWLVTSSANDDGVPIVTKWNVR